MRRFVALVVGLALAAAACGGSSDSCPEGEDYRVIFPLNEGTTTQVDFEVNWTSRTDVVGEAASATIEGPFRHDEPASPPLAAETTVLTLTDGAWVPGNLPVEADAITLGPFEQFRGFYRYEIEPQESGLARIEIRPGFATTPPNCLTQSGDMTADVVQISVKTEGQELAEVGRIETAFWWEVEFTGG